MIHTRPLLLGLAVLGTLATLSFAQEHGRHGRGLRGDRFERRLERMQRFERRAEIRRFVRELEITDAQRAQALAAARAIAPIAESARAERRAILENARKGNQTGDREAIRAAARPQLEALRERTLAQVVPIARGVFDTLTPAQRAKLAAAAERHGRTFDPEKATRRIAFLLARPRAVEFLERRTQR